MSLPKFDHPFSVDELQAVIHALDKGRADKVYVIDVREDFEVDAVPPLPQATVIPMRDLEKALNMWGSDFQREYNAKKPGKKDRIVLYALNARRAMSASSIMNALGYKYAVCLADTFAEYMERTQGKLDEDL
ncbi:hypothetical protein ABL78_1202 [Leptomonas seymouri]|uniref:Rhodanese domain-containing protein n=1 Tax=Leptomonas seymouri TaxID=5684 RepID=A0A0N0P899_LEPSE|nr:hypothetical protein ABL78_1202 [Leptomonas seymouri]|eukprot:KPI89709.1 hypothetical protein ABL78_1202 [Leptomonas seymouri]